MESMNIKSIKIENLFEIFNYTIEYPPEEKVLIITGPNGFGKTQVLNILFNLFNRKFLFFKKLVYDKITIQLDYDISIEIQKNKSKEKSDVTTFHFFEKGKKIETFDYTSKLDVNFIRNIERYLPLVRIEEDEWIDRRTDRVVSLDEIAAEYGDELPNVSGKTIPKIKTKRANEILDSINVHLIREQRLFKKITPRERHYRNDRDQAIMTETIQTYSDELRDIISERSQQSFIISQNLDSSYPNRLISEKKKVSKEEYDSRFADLKEKQEKLTKNGLYESKQKVLGYSKEDSKALLVYLNDLEQKLSVFDDLLEKLELFTNILNERRFTFKSININREKETVN